ncbi:MAG: Sulfite reductase [Fibrobacteres bacterium]|nr:Sulfite reductase [Fibrobacterota bacterium]
MKDLDLVSSESAQHWKKTLSDRLDPKWREDIDNFETDILLKKKGKIEDRVFAETRLRMGAYGQRYDNGHRHDGVEMKNIPFPTDLNKGPETKWDAPGMERIKLPWGGMTADQLDVMAELAEEYSDSILHITTRQDIQLHYIHIENCPSMFRRLAAVNITTREACGNSVRNVTACPIAGVCREEAFDITGYANAVFKYLLGHPDVQDFGRKFKIALSGCKHNPCGLTNIHDLGLTAVARPQPDGTVKRGFEYVVGGGLGAVTYDAKLFSDFVPEEEVLALTQATCRVYARLGEKKKRHRARIKFLVADMGIDKFREAVLEERAKLPNDPRWTDFLATLPKFEEKPLREAGKGIPKTDDAAFDFWCLTNVYPQKQDGFVTVTITLPMGDITSNQARALSDIARKYVKDTMRTTVEQNIVMRWVSEADLYNVYNDLKLIDLAEPGAASIVDITACPGTDTCKLGVSSSRGLAAELRTRLAVKFVEMDEAVRNLRIKVSGCFNSCGQQHIADIGFYGISRNVAGYIVPHFQMVLGGQFTNNGGSYGLATGGIASKAIPAVVDKLLDMYLKGKQKGEIFRAWVERTGKGVIMQSLADVSAVPAYDTDKSYYTDWGSVREYNVKDKGMGECAGEVVSLTEFGLKAADREIFDAQLKYDTGDIKAAGDKAYKAMLLAAQGLVKMFNIDISEDPEKVMAEFRERFYDSKLFFDPIAGPTYANFYFGGHDARNEILDKEKAGRRLKEAQIFLEACHNCNLRMSMGANKGKVGILADAGSKSDSKA